MMGELKSQAEETFLSGLVRVVLSDIECWCGVSQTDVSRDITYLNHRLKHEGIAFMHKTLPTLGKACLSAFQSGRFTKPDAFHRDGSGALPAFLRGLTKRVFDSDGCLLTEPDVDSVWGLQQICFMLYKYELPYSDSVVQTAFNNLRQVDEDLPKTLEDVSLNYKDWSVLAVARNILKDMFMDVDLMQIQPKFGPGSTAEGSLTTYQKYEHLSTHSVSSIYSQGGYNETFLFNGREFFSSYVQSRPMSSESDDRDGIGNDAGPGRVSVLRFVPKDARGPRPIDMQPNDLMWLQQGQRLALEKAATHYSKGRIQFLDQSVNADLALESSRSGRFATLDMKDASNRVATLYFDLQYPENVRAYLRATRSTHTTATLPDGRCETWELKKFAPMGSATCFVVESTFFWSLAVAVLIQDLGYDQADAMENVYVFGDDLIVPTDAAEVIMQHLEIFALLFNKGKCFTRGPFRESCGCDAFLGVDVTPIKLKKRLPASKRETENIVAWLAYSRAFAQAWMWPSSVFISDYIEGLLGGSKLPCCYGDLGCLTTFSFSVERPDGMQYHDTLFENMLNAQSFDLRSPPDGGWSWVEQKYPFLKPYNAVVKRSISPRKRGSGPSEFYGGKRLRVWMVTDRKKVYKASELKDEYLLLEWLSQRKDEPFEACRIREHNLFINRGWIYLT